MGATSAFETELEVKNESKLVVLLVAFLTLAPLAAHNPWVAVQRSLQLDEFQLAEVQQISQLCREQIGPLNRQYRQIQALLRDLSQDPEPDLVAIGQKHLASQELRRETREIEQNCRVQSQMVLTDEQLQKLVRFRRLAWWADRYERAISALKDSGLL